VIKSSCISERFAGASVALLLGISGNPATAAVDGVTGPNVDLTAKEDYISTADGNTALAWGYAYGNGTMQHPGPTLAASGSDPDRKPGRRRHRHPAQCVAAARCGRTFAGLQRISRTGGCHRDRGQGKIADARPSRPTTRRPRKTKRS
jgi:hypothetical protein